MLRPLKRQEFKYFKLVASSCREDLDATNMLFSKILVLSLSRTIESTCMNLQGQEMDD
jgi:hypothetical protein